MLLLFSIFLLLLVLIVAIRSKFRAESSRLTGLQDLHQVGKPVPTSKRLGNRAVVVGASWAGCLATKVLLDHFDEVVVIENEALGTHIVTAKDAATSSSGEATNSKPRFNVAQQWYGHAVLALGLKIVRAVFGEDIIKLFQEHGAVVIDTGEMDFHHFGVQLVKAPTGEQSLIASRFLLESVLRHFLFTKVQHEGRLIYRPNHQVRGLLCEVAETVGSSSKPRVRGVQVKHNKNHDAPLEELEADFVVDATGRAQMGNKWLEKLGINVPKECFDSKVSYSAGLYSNKGKNLDFQHALFAFGDHREFSRLALFQNVEGDISQLTLMAVAGHTAATDSEGIKEYLGGVSIPSRMLKNLELLGEPLAPWKSYRPGACQMVKYQNYPSLPEGFVAVGDAFACFNPTYGQGLTTSSLTVLTLDRILREFENNQVPRSGSGSGYGTRSIDGVTDTYFKLVAERLQVSWMLPKCGDYSYPTTDTAAGETGDELIYKWFQSYMCRVIRLSTLYPHIRSQFYKTLGMTDFGAKLFFPHISLFVLANVFGFIKIPTISSKPDEKKYPYVNSKLPLRGKRKV